jgi:nucleoside-diphosphate-sugar epimerase
MDYVIHRPTGYFYDIIKVFRPFIEKGEMQLLKGYGDVKANVVSCPDFAEFIVQTLDRKNEVFEVGGKETYTYEEMAKLCFDAAKKPLVIKYAPKFLFSILANLPKIKKAGKRDVILFSKFTLSHDLVGRDEVGNSSFKEYIYESFK